MTLDIIYSEARGNEPAPAISERDQFEPDFGDYYYQYWGFIYSKLINDNQSKMNPVVDSLNLMFEEKQLNSIEIAHALVKFVQNIPYHYVMEDPCDDQHNNHPCIDGQKFGITTPIQFLSTLDGDCDSRTVLLQTMLSVFGIPSLIMVSNEYAHSMLAVNIPSYGDYITFNDQRYYFWETTSIGWEPGILPPSMNNLTYWDIAYHHE